jgi:hypothetical protein
MTSIAIRIPESMQKEMRRLKINWSEYLRQSIQEALESETKRGMFERIHRLLGPRLRNRRGTSARLIRDLRDHG